MFTTAPLDFVTFMLWSSSEVIIILPSDVSFTDFGFLPFNNFFTSKKPFTVAIAVDANPIKSFPCEIIFSVISQIVEKSISKLPF